MREMVEGEDASAARECLVGTCLSRCLRFSERLSVGRLHVGGNWIGIVLLSIEFKRAQRQRKKED